MSLNKLMALYSYKVYSKNLLNLAFKMFKGGRSATLSIQWKMRVPPPFWLKDKNTCSPLNSRWLPLIYHRHEWYKFFSVSSRLEWCLTNSVKIAYLFKKVTVGVGKRKNCEGKNTKISFSLSIQSRGGAQLRHQSESQVNVLLICLLWWRPLQSFN